MFINEQQRDVWARIAVTNGSIFPYQILKKQIQLSLVNLITQPQKVNDEAIRVTGYKGYHENQRYLQ